VCLCSGWVLVTELIKGDEDDDKYLDSNASQNIGEIALKIWRVTVGRTMDVKHGWRHGKQMEDEQKVHEKSKKATTHRIKYVALRIPIGSLFPPNQSVHLTYPHAIRLGKEITGRRRRATTAHDMDSEPICTFIFKYRPLGAPFACFPVMLLLRPCLSYT
jgi:hypothetical protein